MANGKKAIKRERNWERNHAWTANEHLLKPFIQSLMPLGALPLCCFEVS